MTKEVVLAVLMKGHRGSPRMKVGYMQGGWLARTARGPGSLQTLIQAVWEATAGRPRPTGPAGRLPVAGCSHSSVRPPVQNIDPLPHLAACQASPLSLPWTLGMALAVAVTGLAPF